MFEDFLSDVVSEPDKDLIAEDEISVDFCNWADLSSEDDMYMVCDEEITLPDWLMEPDSITELSTS